MDNLNTKAVVSLTGLNENTLRAWERRYGAVSPARNAGGHRTYSQQEVARLRLLLALVRQGHQISNIATLPLAKLKSLFAQAPSKEIKTPIHGQAEEQHRRKILAALESFNLEKLNQSLLAARFELSPKNLVMHLILPLMSQVGSLVQKNELSIAQEHILSSLLRDYLGQIYQSLSPYEFSSKKTETFALTTREGDMHEFGILISAILCSLHRKRTHYLGPNMPAAELVQACEQFSIKNLVLGVSAIPKERELISAPRFLAYLDKHLPKRITFWFGGSAELPPLKTERKIFVISQMEKFDQFLAGEA